MTSALPDAAAAAQALIDRHFQIWNASDAATRLAQFAQVYTPDFFVADEHGVAEGHANVNALIQKVQDAHSGFVFSPAPITWNHGIGRVTWGYGPRSQPNQVRGEDIFTIRDGQLASAHVFLDPQA